MTGHPLFSVLIANYNNGCYLQQAIDSVMAQTYDNWEIILVDDGSTDNSAEIYKKYESDPRFHIYFNDKNHGCGYTKRRCAELANGEICGFLDPDDELMPNALDVSIRNLVEHPNSVLSISRFYYCDESLNINKESRLLKLSDNETYLEHGDYCPEAFSAYLNEAYKKTAGINAYLKAGVDQDLYFRIEEQGKVSVVDKFTYKYRICQNSVSRDADYAFFWNLKVRFDAFQRRSIEVTKDNPLYMSFSRRIAYSYQEGKKKGSDLVHKTYAYRLGKFILKPITFIMKKK